MKKLIIILLVILSTSCSTTHVRMKREVPAEINLSRFKEITFDSVSGPHSNYLSSALKNNFSKSKHLKLILNGTKKSTKVLTVSAEVLDNNFDQSHEKNIATCFTLKKAYACTLYTTTAKWNATVLLQLTDSATGEVFKQINLTKSFKKSKESEKGYVNYKKDKGFKTVMTIIAKSFSNTVQPHKVKVKVKLFSDDSIPDLERGIGFAKRSNWKVAAKYFKKAIDLVKTKQIDSTSNTSDKLLSNAMNMFSDDNKNSNLIYASTASKAYYAYGVALGYGGIDYDAAIEYIDKAIALKNDSDYSNERLNIERFKQDAAKLAEQGYK